MLRPWTVARWAAGGALVLAVWVVRDYRLPRPARTHLVNKAKVWEFKTRFDAKGVEQVWVPPGGFEMGSNPLDDPRARATETPRHPVCISAGFWLDRFEVTNESFLQFVREGIRRPA